MAERRFGKGPKPERVGARRRDGAASPVPPYRPQLALLVKEAPKGDDWLHEAKYDGYRIGARVVGNSVSLISRRDQDWTAAFPKVAKAVGDLGLASALFDGEVAILEPGGKTNFQLLQNAFQNGVATNVVYFVFDLLWQNGDDLSKLPLEQRKMRLEQLIGPNQGGLIQYASHVIADGKAVHERACAMGLEGIVSKRRSVPYRWGKRDPSWQKVKCVSRQEFVIGGFTEPEGSREGIGALLIGYYDDKKELVFSGKVGTGFTHALAIELRARLNALITPDCPFVNIPPERARWGINWVRPELVGEVQFTEWTNDGTLRHPSFQGLRPDKKASDVRLERPSTGVLKRDDA
jgi:bifunctional non-homologous end joining protein LigD